MDLTNIFGAIITLIFALITYFVIPILREKVSQEDFVQIKMWVKIAVQAAEMIFTETGLGAKKKEYVENFLNEKGFTIDSASLDNMIESAVLELKRAAND